MKLRLAIEYPSEYNYEKNWFDTTITMVTIDKLSINVPEYMNNVNQ